MVPEHGRGEGYDIGAVLDEYVASVENVAGASQTGPGILSLGGSAPETLGISDMSGVFDRSAAVARTRLGYFQPSRVLARTGRSEDVPQALRGRDLSVPYYVRRALELERAEGVVVHSVVLKLLLP